MAFILAPRTELRILSQLPRLQQTFRPGNSRASCSWTRIGAANQYRLRSRAQDTLRYHLHRDQCLSTSAARKADPRDTNKHAGGAPVHNEKPEPATATAKLASTLKSKLKPIQTHENIYNIPNVLTFSRLIATPVLGYLIVENYHLYAFGLFVYAGFSDLLDGWIARRWKLQTVVGSVVDPMADKALMTTLVTCLAINGTLPLPLATLILGRDVSLAIAAIYFRYASLPAPKTMARYWDFSLPSAEVHPTTISKLNTFLQLGLIGTLLATNLLHDPSATESAAGGLLLAMQDALGGPEGVQSMVRWMSGVVAGTTAYSGLSYVWTKSAVKILGDDKELIRKQGMRGRMIIGGTFGSVVLAAALLWWREMERKEAEESEAAEEK
ncbi:hypothetical protein BS50DRAFT_570397 [Corynespora cassiicola Philippines]|uniref:Cardiolipin synthetase n=1 Tax=Corynespora cassiicola Philippines TaxID=1448308 RepID=A0A2T2NZY2_CORCC|nr:hypothetical protein BS50DRAFT_570397 [Corynespora cassiicola Philippines]